MNYFIIFFWLIFLLVIGISILRKIKPKNDNREKFDKWKEEFNLFDNYKRVRRPEILWTGNEIAIESKKQIQEYFLNLEEELSRKIGLLEEVEKDYLKQISDALLSQNHLMHTQLIQGYPKFNRYRVDIQNEHKRNRDQYMPFISEKPISKDAYEKRQKETFNSLFRNKKLRQDVAQENVNYETTRNLSEIRAIEEINEKKRIERQAQLQKKEFIQKLQDDQKKSLERLLFNRQIQLVDIMNSHCYGGTYIIRNNINNNLYVGSSENLFKRIGSHLNSLKLGKHHSFKL